jgi:hypothetical protein
MLDLAEGLPKLELSQPLVSLYEERPRTTAWIQYFVIRAPDSPFYYELRYGPRSVELPEPVPLLARY